MGTLRIALVQMDVEMGNWEENSRRAQVFLEQVFNLQAQICILPEMWSTGFALDNDFFSLASRNFEKTIDLMRSWARTFRFFLLGGTIPEVSGKEIFNTCYLVSPFGEITGSYRKRKLFPLLKEEKFFSPGKEVPIFSTPWGKIGVQICYELRFPEGFKELRVKGANIVFLPAQFPHPRESHWETLIRARAIENQFYVVGCNRVGSDPPSLNYFGNSMIVDPGGEVLLTGRGNECVISLEIDLSKVEKIRKELPLLQD
ncbi:MAG: carbon-nitrogen family hydrolase [Caldiserica bacterium]|jgi:predicted amidohydrolase|nr:carbon-nitrogen family hydrolase [Caldisericota bacterium]MDH7563055.1 carbon-nitrogen family hydrolase [Caldisericota bacterium]